MSFALHTSMYIDECLKMVYRLMIYCRLMIYRGIGVGEFWR